MLAVSMPTLSLTPVTSSLRTRRVKRYRGLTMASASLNVENVKLTQGLGDLPKVVLTSAHGRCAFYNPIEELCGFVRINQVKVAILCVFTIYTFLFGGCVTSWKVADKDLLFVRPDAVFNGQKPISGGVPHCFPQFGPGALIFFMMMVVVLNQVTTKYIDGSFQLALALGDSWSHAATNRIILYWNGNERYAYIDKSPSLKSASAPYAVTQRGIRNLVSTCKRVKLM